MTHARVPRERSNREIIEAAIEALEALESYAKEQIGRHDLPDDVDEFFRDAQDEYAWHIYDLAAVLDRLGGE